MSKNTSIQFRYLISGLYSLDRDGEVSVTKIAFNQIVGGGTVSVCACVWSFRFLNDCIGSIVEARICDLLHVGSRIAPYFLSYVYSSFLQIQEP